MSSITLKSWIIYLDFLRKKEEKKKIDKRKKYTLDLACASIDWCGKERKREKPGTHIFHVPDKNGGILTSYQPSDFHLHDLPVSSSGLLFSFGGSSTIISLNRTGRSSCGLSISLFWAVFIVTAIITCCIAKQYFEQNLEHHGRPEQHEPVQDELQKKDNELGKVGEPAAVHWIQLEINIQIWFSVSRPDDASIQEHSSVDPCTQHDEEQWIA